MSDFLGRLAARALGTEVPLRPRVASRFEPETSPPDPLSHRTPLQPGEGEPLAADTLSRLMASPPGEGHDPIGANVAAGRNAASPTVETPRGASPTAAPFISEDLRPRDPRPEAPRSMDPGPRDLHPRDPGPRDLHPRDPGLRDLRPRDPRPTDLQPRDPRIRDLHPLNSRPRDAGPRDLHGGAVGVPGGGDAPRGASTEGGTSIEGNQTARGESGRANPFRGREIERARPRSESSEPADGSSPSPGGKGGRWERGPGGEVPGRSAVSSSEASPAAHPSAPAPTPPIRVTIGRIEVRATTPAPPPAPPRPVAGPRMNLEDYLRRRREGKL